MTGRAPATAVAQSPEQIAAALRLAREDGRALRVFTAPWMAAAYGVRGLDGGGDGAGEVVLDCGADAATALAALRAGWRRIAFSGDAGAGRKLRAIAGRAGAQLVAPPDPPDLVLRYGDDARARLAALWTGTGEGGQDE